MMRREDRENAEPTERGGPAGPAWLPVAFVSAGVLAFEVVVMRLLLIASWHHFAFLVISIALLGSGAGGAALCLGRRWLLPRAGPVLMILSAATAVSMPVCVALSGLVPLEARLVPALLARQIGAWIAYWALLSIPFFLGGSMVGLAIMHARGRVALVYAANLIGSGVGALATPLAMAVFAPAQLPIFTAAIASLGVVMPPRPAARCPRLPVFVAVILAVSMAAWLTPRQVRMDQYKYGAYAERLVEQGDAGVAADAFSAHGLVRVYRGEVFHDLPFLSAASAAAPPEMLSITIDGHQAASLLRINEASEAEALDHTLGAAAYELLPVRPDVLLLGEIGGSNIWLAQRAGAAAVWVAQPDDRLVDLLREDFADEGGGIWRRARVGAVTPRLFVEQTRRRFDLIQIVSLESLAAGGGGMGGLAEDHLVTVQGLARCLRLLTDDGLLVACRGIQEPPRDNIKYLATAAAALRAVGAGAPAEHVLIVRDYLAVCTVVKRTPWNADDVSRIREIVQRRELTPVWFPGIEDEELNQPDRLPGPEGVPGDWYHHAAGQLLTEEGHPGDFIASWTFDIRPPTDDRPFFADYFRARSVPAMRRAFGELWLTRTELAYLFAAAATVLIGVIGAGLTFLPLLAVKRIRRSPGKTATAAYFVALGLAYMAIEMTALSWTARIIGEPVSAAALTIATFLLASGAGSALAQRITGRRRRAVWLAATGIALWVALLAAIVPPLLAWVAPLPLLARALCSVGAIAPLAFCMGMPFPLGLARLDHSAPQLVPWAWAVNGFASVLAPPAATLVAMSWGWSIAAGGALAMYLLAAATWGRVAARVSVEAPVGAGSVRGRL